jgi:kynurenine formamidase
VVIIKLIDLTHVIQHNMTVYPGDSEVSLTPSHYFSQDGYSNHQLSINMHAGTHIDGPMHLLQSETYISDVALDTFIGVGAILDVSGEQFIDYRESYEQLVPEHCILILHTGYGRYYGEERYYEGHPSLTTSFAQFLIRKKVKMIGLDMPSPDHFPFDIHKLLFEHHILIAENLANVEQLLQPTAFTIIALPLHIKADSSIARIIAQINE